MERNPFVSKQYDTRLSDSFVCVSSTVTFDLLLSLRPQKAIETMAECNTQLKCKKNEIESDKCDIHKFNEYALQIPLPI